MRQALAEVISNEKVLGELERSHARTISGNWLMWLRCPEIAREARPGQFVMVGCGEECVLPRPFSIHRVKDNGDIAIFFAVWEDGTGTRWLSQRNQGDSVEITGPLGNGFSIPPKARNLLLVAGGIGIAPLRFLAQAALKQDCSITHRSWLKFYPISKNLQGRSFYPYASSCGSSLAKSNSHAFGVIKQDFSLCLRSRKPCSNSTNFL